MLSPNSGRPEFGPAGAADQRTISYSYDATYRILQAITSKRYETYSYDSVGNRTTGPGSRDTGYISNSCPSC